MPESSYSRATTLPPTAASTLVATIKAVGAPGSQTPGGPPTQEVPGRWLGAGSELPVLAQEVGWVEVGLAQRPNESVAWVPADDVTLATDTFHIVVDLATTQLQLFNRAQLLTLFLPASVCQPIPPHRAILHRALRSVTVPRLRTVRDRHLRTQHSHQRLGRIRRHPDRDPRRVGLRRRYWNDRRPDIPRLHPPPCRRSRPTAGRAGRHTHRHHWVRLKCGSRRMRYSRSWRALRTGV